MATARKKKTEPKIQLNTGAVLRVTVGNETKQYGCSGSNEVSGRDYKEVLKQIQDCIERNIKAASRPK